MLRSAVGKVVWVGRATVFLVGLAVILAVLFGVASSAMAANGNPLKLGMSNFASAITTLTKSGAGPALSLKVGSGPPLAVNSSSKVANLNADQLDGKDASELSALPEVEPWHEVGSSGEPVLDSPWQHYGQGFNTPAFYKDPFGRVYIKGVVKRDLTSEDLQLHLFTLPPGYRPAAVENQGGFANGGEDMVRIHPDGRVMARGYDEIYMDSVSFRAAN